MPVIPSEYNMEQYVSWHEGNWPEDKDLKNRLKSLREDLKISALDDLRVLTDLLYFVIPNCKNEYDIQKREFSFEIPLKEALVDTSKNQFDLLFKSVESTLDKLWRKNKRKEDVTLSNITVNITDLIRTEVICNTLSACKFVAEHLKSEHIKLPPDYYLKSIYDNKIKKIEFEPEMKMASGYFAYHGLVYFKSGLIIELQIYSELTKNWRNLSHKVYNKARLNPTKIIDFGTTEARLISLGHLLHLAECEASKLEEEIK